MDDRNAWALSLVIPAFNEEAGIATAIAEADDALAALAADYEVLIVDDGSSDATAAVAAAEAEGRPHVRVLRHSQNQGYGAALRTGFESARFPHVAFTDADCQFDLNDLARLVPLAAQHPLVVGYRVKRQDPWRRRFFSWGYNVLARTLLGTRVRDCDCALKVFRKAELAHLLPQTRGFFVNTEMLTRARQHGYDVAEVGVRHRPRLRGESKVSLGDIPRTLRTFLPFWWSQVLFTSARAADRETGSPEVRECLGASRHTIAASILLMVIAGLLFFGRLGVPLQEPQEPRYAEIPRQMLAEGRLVVPVLHGQDYLDKPPLLYWLVMGCYQVFGVHDWAARLVPCTAGFLCILVTYWWGWRTVGPRAALVGALVLCLSARFVQVGRLLNMDGLLCLCVVAALAAAHVAMQESRLRIGWWLLSAVACGLGLLTKGPVTLILIGAPVLVYAALDPRAARPRRGMLLAYLGIAIGIAAPWYVAAIASDPGFSGYFFLFHNVQRFVAPFDHEEPIWFYLPELLLGMLPWTLLLPGLIRHLRAPEAERPPALGFFLLAFAGCFTFFSLAGCKRPGYLLPALPPLALALGCYLDTLLPRESLWQSGFALLRHRSAPAFGATAVVLFAGLAGAVTATISGLFALATGIGLALLAGLGLALVLHGGRRSVPWAVCGAATFLVLIVALHELLPNYARRFSMRGQVRRHVEDVDVPVACYPRRWDSISFYLQRDDVRVYKPEESEQLFTELQARPRTLVYIKTVRWLDEFQRALPESLEFVPEGRQGFVTTGWVQPRQSPRTVVPGSVPQ